MGTADLAATLCRRMARKDRVPNPPRRVQAPQKRTSPTVPSGPGSQRKLLLGIGAGLVAVLVVVLGFLLLGGGGKSEAAVLQEEGCTLRSFPGQEANHVDDPEAKPKWNSTPPTSGDHSSTPAVYGFYRTPVDFINSLHNLEHGAVAIHFGDEVPDETVEQLQTFYDEDSNGLIVAQLPELDDKITLSAWTAAQPGDRGRGYLATCTGFSERAFSKFIEEHRYQGPERLPEDSLRPGST
jgi:hypothetical protein